MAERSGRRAARVWAGSELRRRWRSTVLLGLLAGITAGIALAATAGARRTDTAWDRLRAVTLASDAVAFPSNVGIDDADWSKVAQLPEVAALGGVRVPVLRRRRLRAADRVEPGLVAHRRRSPAAS